MTEETKKQNVGILNWWWNSNRGAILTCYAIYELVKEFGHNPLVIKHIPYDYYNTEYKNSISEKLGIGPDECTADGKFSLEACRCIGACGLAPVLTVNDEVYGKLTGDDIPGILEKYMA